MGESVELLERLISVGQHGFDRRLELGSVSARAALRLGGVGYVLVGGREDYLKSVFEKTGVRGRRELVAKMFAEQHWPHYGDGDAFLDADAWFAQSRSTENPASTS